MSAHRGSSGAAPENTLAAVALAKRHTATSSRTTSSARPTTAEIAAAAPWTEQVNPAVRAIDGTVDAVHAQGMEAHVWTVHDGQGMRRAISWDVDGIITNYPQVLRDILRS